MFDQIVTLCWSNDDICWAATADGVSTRTDPYEGDQPLTDHLRALIDQGHREQARLLICFDRTQETRLSIIAAALNATHKGDISIWPAQTAEKPVVLTRVDFDMLTAEVSATGAQNKADTSAKLMAGALRALSASGQLPEMLQTDPSMPDKHVLGTEYETTLRGAVPTGLQPPRLRDDCFAMPQGVDWVPVDTALARLRAALSPVTQPETIDVTDALGRILVADCHANRSNPPRPNSAVDGYGFAHASTGSGPQNLPLVEGRAAAGQPFDGAVPPGAAVRILTGAILPKGVDTVVLEEDTATDGATVVFDGPVKPNANTRKAGEDVEEGALALPAGHRLRAPDLALLCALGIAQVTVYKPLRVGVLSTGDEIIPTPGQPALPHQIYDANRPMLLSLAREWGFHPVDLGHVRDDPALIEARLTKAADTTDVIFTSGGASAGDEDHVSTLLRTKGTLSSWRIALKPGRPLALAMWQGTPVLGLPGNPVAALVCALIFGRPSLGLLAGEGWQEPLSFQVPAAFHKRKKPGRREYLRARLTPEGSVDVFHSEGSGRISGLSWANGIVELSDDAQEVTPGTPVRFLPYSGFCI